MLTAVYHPWTAEFKDGTAASRFVNHELEFKQAVAPRLELVYAFYIHFQDRVLIGVRMDDGFFYKGARPGSVTDWFPPPRWTEGARELVYRRRCVAAFDGVKYESSVRGYVLGYKNKTGGETLMGLDTCGHFVWL